MTGPGTRLGAYEVIAQIGEGGMGQVYRARDTKLNRDVAIKVLPELFASDPERLARFTREAQTLASLNHPHIAAIYGIEDLPPQARGKAVDKRADIWAFGVVLYEMLSGRRAFDGETITDVMAAVVTREPDWAALPAGTPRAIRTVLRRCLQKDPRRRLRDIADARIEMDEIEAPDPAAGPGPASPGAGRRSVSSRALMVTALVMLAIGAAGGVTWRASRDAPPSQWIGTRLGGPMIAMYPHVSPDGQLVAFEALVDGLSQVAVMKPGTGAWTVLTHDRAHGLVDALNWSPDGARIFYDRRTDSPSGIYSVPALGGDERQLIENASAPQPLADGTLLFLRINAARKPQLHRLWPATGRIAALPVVTSDRGCAGCRGFVQPFGDGRVVVMGHAQSDGDGADRLHVLTLDSGDLRPFGPDIPDMQVARLSIAVGPDRQSVLVALPQAGTFRVVRIRQGATAPEPVLTFLSRPNFDVGPDGSLYVSLMERPEEVLRLRGSGAGVEKVASGPGGFDSHVVALPDGRVLVVGPGGAALRVLVAAPGKEPVALVETGESTQGPMTSLGPGRAAVMIGSGTAREIAVVAVDTGRILKRLKAPAGITSLGASPDGATLYVSAAGSIAALPVDGGPARTICPGDSLTVDPDTGDLIVKLDELERFRLVRVSPAGGSPRPIEIHGSLRLIPEPLSSGAVRQGRLLLPVATADSWYWYLGTLDLQTGRLDKMDVNYVTDFHFATWAADGSVIGAGSGVQSALWKFAPEKR